MAIQNWRFAVEQNIIKEFAGPFSLQLNFGVNLEKSVGFLGDNGELHKVSLYWHFFAILPVRQGLSCCIFPCRVIHRCQGHREWEPDSLVIVPLCWPPTSSKSRANLFGAAPSTQIHSFISFSKSVYHVWLGSKSIEMEASQLRHFGKPCQMQSDIDLRVSALLPDASPFSVISKNTCQVFLQFGNLNIFNLWKDENRWSIFHVALSKKLAKRRDQNNWVQ